MARDEEVDFIIQGGDFFDKKEPSTPSLIKAMDILSNKIYGSKNIGFEVRSNRGSAQYKSNFSQSMQNIDLPIFCIHGNHDYLSHENGNESILKLFSVSKMVNYFGSITSTDQLQLEPICFKKKRRDGTEIGIALYGIGFVADRMLRALMMDRDKVKIIPPDDEYDREGNLQIKYKRILVIHQNRFKGHQGGAPRTNCIEENILPPGFDLAIWGHEHDCHTSFQSYTLVNGGDRIEVYQPGSSVATSLTEGEAKDKQVGVLSWDGKYFGLEKTLKVPRQRPIGFCDIDFLKVKQEVEKKHKEDNLQSGDDIDQVMLQSGIAKIVEEEITKMMKEVKDKPFYNDLIKPLLRIRIRKIQSDFKGIFSTYIDQLEKKYEPQTANK